MQAMAECSGPPQSTRKDVLGTFYPSPEPVDSSTPSSAPLSRRTLLRHSSFVRAVCVDAPVRICAGGDQRWSSLPRHLPLKRFVIFGLTTIRPESRLLLLSTPMPPRITKLRLSFPKSGAVGGGMLKHWKWLPLGVGRSSGSLLLRDS